MPRYADQQLGIVRIGDVRREHGVVRRFLAQLVRFAGEHPHQRVEPEERGRDPGQQQFGPVHARNVRKLMSDDRLCLAGRFDGLRAEQDDRTHQSPADRRGELVAGEQSGTMLETHAALRTGEGAQPVAVD